MCFDSQDKVDIAVKFIINPSTPSSMIKSKENIIKAAKSGTRLKFRPKNYRPNHILTF